MLKIEEIFEKAKSLGFDHYGVLDPRELEFLDEVRKMCASDRCHMYGRNWTCPPGCGTVAEMRDRALQYKRGLLVQSTGQMEDDFDLDVMMDTEDLQKERFAELANWVVGKEPNCMAMGTGTCVLCEECTYPDHPCRFPDRAQPSMEACGLMVADVCKAAGLKYYYGPQTITFTSCILFD